MSKFDELKKRAEAVLNNSGSYSVVSRNALFLYACKPEEILELFAIQAQLVAALKAAKTWHNGEKWRDSSDPSEVRAWEQHRDIIAAALAAVEVKP